MRARHSLMKVNNNDTDPFELPNLDRIMQELSDKRLEEMIWKAFENHHDAACVEFVQLARARHPEKPFWEFLLGELYRRLGEFTRAEPHLLVALRRFGKGKGSVELSLARTHQMLRHDSLASQFFSAAIDAAPERAESYVFFAAYLIERERFNEALDVLRRATANPNLTGAIDEVFLNEGLILRTLGRFAESAHALQRALDTDPNSVRARSALEDVTLAQATRDRTRIKGDAI